MAEQVRRNRQEGPGAKLEGEHFDGVLQGFPTQLRTVHPSWNDALFGTLYRFYGSFPHVQQLVWPDRNGVWPWQEGVTQSCQLRQAQAWLPVSEHPKGCWQLIGAKLPGFPLECGPDCEVLTTRSVLTGTRKVATVVNEEGLDLLDERGYSADDFIFAYIGDLIDDNPQLNDLDDSRKAQRAVIGTNGQWSYRHVSAHDRRNSKRAWEAVIAEENARLQ